MISYNLLLNSVIVIICTAVMCPLIGVFIVQKNMSVIADALSHIAISGVALGLVAGSIFKFSDNSLLVLPATILVCILGSIAVEKIAKKASGDVAIGILLYGGMALGVFLINLMGGTSTKLVGYLFGSISIISNRDVLLFIIIMLIVLLTVVIFKNIFSLINNDIEYAKSLGINTGRYNVLFSILTAFTVAISIQTIGVLLIGALMILPVVIATQFANSFNKTIIFAIIIAVIISTVSVIITYFINTPASSLIVLVLILFFIISSIFRK